MWLRSSDGSSGRGVVLFDTEEPANATAALAREGPPAGAPIMMTSVETFRVVGGLTLDAGPNPPPFSAEPDGLAAVSSFDPSQLRVGLPP